MPAEELDPLFDPPPEPGAQPLSYRQGRIVTFNLATLENTVQVGQTVLSNLPLLGVAEADTLAAGSVVGLLVTGAEYAIVGRFVRPNTAEAVDAINRLSSQIQSVQVNVGESTTSTVYTDLTTIGPVVPVTVRSSGRLIIMTTADITADKAGGVGGGLMSVQIADVFGSVIYSASDVTMPALQHMYSDNATHSVGDSIGATRLGLIALAPGSYVVTAKYSAQGGGGNASFSRRNVTCISL